MLLFGALFAAVAAVVFVRQDLPGRPPPIRGVNAVAIPFFIVSGVLHELGHFFASRPYFKASIRLGLLSGIIPAFITKTNDAWACPRGIRIWINLAGPLVDLLIALVLRLLHLTVLPDVHLIVTLILVQLLRVVFVLNPSSKATATGSSATCSAPSTCAPAAWPCAACAPAATPSTPALPRLHRPVRRAPGPDRPGLVGWL